MDVLFSQGDGNVELSASTKATKKTKEKITVYPLLYRVDGHRSPCNEQRGTKNLLYAYLKSGELTEGDSGAA